MICFALENNSLFLLLFSPPESTLVHGFCLQANRKDKGSKQGLAVRARIVSCELAQWRSLPPPSLPNSWKQEQTNSRIPLLAMGKQNHVLWHCRKTAASFLCLRSPTAKDANVRLSEGGSGQVNAEMVRGGVQGPKGLESMRHIFVIKEDFQLGKLVILNDDQMLRLSFQKPWTYKLISYKNMITFEYKFNARETWWDFRA